MKERKIKLGEYVVITVTNDILNHKVDYVGKVIEIEHDGRSAFPESVEITIKNSVLRSGAWNRKTFKFDRKTWPAYGIRVLNFYEMSLRMAIRWWFRNVVFPPRYTTVYTPPTSLVTKTV